MEASNLSLRERAHQSIRVSPAVEAGITDHIWTLRELLDARIWRLRSDSSTMPRL